MRTLPWFRMYAEAVDDPKLRLLAFEDRWHFVAILCCKCQGILDKRDPEIVRRMVAVKLGLDLRELDEAARRLSEVGLIDEKTLHPIAWEGRQFKSDDSKERVRKYRERKRKNKCNGDETLQKRPSSGEVTAQDTDTDTEKEGKRADSGPTLDDEDEGEKPLTPAEVVDNYHAFFPNARRVEKMTSMRRKHLTARIKHDLPEPEDWEAYFHRVGQSDFLMGRAEPSPGRKPFVLSIDFLINETRCAEIREGKYD